MLQTIAIKVLSDLNFATALISTPDATLRAEGFTPTPAMVDALAHVTVDDLRMMADMLKNGRAAF
jgi:hypothetical protein